MINSKNCIINFQEPKIIKKLESLGFNCIPVINSPFLSRPVSRHSDMLYLQTSKNTFLSSVCQEQNKIILENAGYTVNIFCGLKPGYTTESFLNFIINKKYVIQNPKTALQIDIDDKQIVCVKQGYTRCSVLQVSDNSYITDDDGIYKELLNIGADCLKISKGIVKLTGYEYGFIGGASVKLDDHNVLFFGEIEDGVIKKQIQVFLDERGVKAHFVCGMSLTDIGSAILF